MPKHTFAFRQFTIRQDRCAMKVGTDGVLLGAWADVGGVKSALDIGTGTGLIALMLAQRAPAAVIHAVEIDRESALQARENADASPWADRVKVIDSPIQVFAENPPVQYDLIVSNPPFFRDSLKSIRAGRNIVRHTETLSFGDLVKAVSGLLAPGGRFCFILPPGEALVFERIALSSALFKTRYREMRSRPGKPVERVLMQLERESRPPVCEPVLTLHPDDSGQRSEEYAALTSAFYL